MAAQMGLSIREINMLTLKDFNLLRMGYNLKVDEIWDYVRNLMAEMRNDAFGSNGKYTAKSIMPIPSIDFEVKNNYIRTREQAEKLLKLFV